VLLSPAADSPQWNGLLERGLPGEEPVSTLRYQVGLADLARLEELGVRIVKADTWDELLARPARRRRNGRRSRS
jgi:hypothetical protein